VEERRGKRRKVGWVQVKDRELPDGRKQGKAGMLDRDTLSIRILRQQMKHSSGLREGKRSQMRTPRSSLSSSSTHVALALLN
jgi:hypothetical protein